MTHAVTITCDKCGAVKADDKDPDRAWWDFQYVSTDFPVAGGYQFKSGSWDLCPDCSLIAHDALVAAIGKPQRDSDPLA